MSTPRSRGATGSSSVSSDANFNAESDSAKTFQKCSKGGSDTQKTRFSSVQHPPPLRRSRWYGNACDHLANQDSLLWNEDNSPWDSSTKKTQKWPLLVSAGPPPEVVQDCRGLWGTHLSLVNSDGGLSSSGN